MSRLFAACFMCASRLSGSLMLMDVVLGFRLGKITRCALLQSTISAESVFSQYSRSSCSDFKLGALFFIDLSFFPRHGPRRNDTSFCIVSSKCKSHMQPSTVISNSQCMPARFLCAVPLIWGDNQWLIEE